MIAAQMAGLEMDDEADDAFYPGPINPTLPSLQQHPEFVSTSLPTILETPSTELDAPTLPGQPAIPLTDAPQLPVNVAPPAAPRPRPRRTGGRSVPSSDEHLESGVAAEGPVATDSVDVDTVQRGSSKTTKGRKKAASRASAV